MPRACCVPVVVPDDIKLIIRPAGGQADYKSLLHEGGHGAGRNFAALDNLLDLVGDFIGPFFLRPDLETFVMNVHGHGPHASNRRAVRKHP